MKAVLIPGDGIGPEISASVESITKAMNLEIGRASCRERV